MSGNHDHLVARGKETQQVAVVGAVVNLILAVAKITFGYLGRSHSLIADGIHSLSDLLSDVLVWWAAHHASHGPDEAHPYGHGRFETAATLALGAMLVLVSGGIIWDAIERLFEADRRWMPSTLALYAAIFSILANEGLYWYTRAVAKRVRSDMLMANAWHHRSDAVSSMVVVVGVGGTLLGIFWLDALAAVIVGVMVAKIGYELGQDALFELVDTGLEEEVVNGIRDVIQAIDGVKSLHMLRTRKRGHEASADVHVQVSSRLTVSEGHMISMAVEEEIKANFDEITDVTVHIDPEDDESAPPCEGLPLRNEAVNQLKEIWSGLDELRDVQHMQLHYLSGQIHIDLVFPVTCFKGDRDSREIKARFSNRLEEHAEYGEVKIIYSAQ